MKRGPGKWVVYCLCVGLALSMLPLTACSADAAYTPQSTRYRSLPEATPQPPPLPVPTEEPTPPVTKADFLELPDMDQLPLLREEQLSAYYFMLRTCRPDTQISKPHNIYWSPDSFVEACFNNRWHNNNFVSAAIDDYLEFEGFESKWGTEFTFGKRPEVQIVTSGYGRLTTQELLLYRDGEPYISLFFKYWDGRWTLPLLIERVAGDTITYARHRTGRGLWVVHTYSDEQNIVRQVWYSPVYGSIELDCVVYCEAIDAETVCRLSVATEILGVTQRGGELVVDDTLLLRSYQRVTDKNGDAYGVCYELYYDFREKGLSMGIDDWYPALKREEYRFHVTDMITGGLLAKAGADWADDDVTEIDARKLSQPFSRRANETEPCLFTLPDAGLYGRTPSISPEGFVAMLGGKEAIVPGMIPVVLEQMGLSDKAAEFEAYVTDKIKDGLPVRFVAEVKKPQKARLQNGNCSIQEVRLGFEIGPEFDKKTPVLSAVFVKDNGGWRMTVLEIGNPSNYDWYDDMYLSLREKEAGKGLWASFYWYEWAMGGSYTYKYLYDVYTGAMWHKRMELEDHNAYEFYQSHYDVQVERREELYDTITLNAVVSRDVYDDKTDGVVRVEYYDAQTAVYAQNPYTGLPELRYFEHQPGRVTGEGTQSSASVHRLHVVR